MAAVAPISIHAPVKGATLLRYLFPAVLLHFNPRSREGSDKQRASANSAILYFNPRSREGSDEYVEDWEPQPEQFQSTLP